ncbi:7 alpha-cephem-methoxylase [Penicillium sp. IBT 35674x]|nr:7 alpha-cephem-methoxylase [Penicillium sp. IBT 35674x]
MPTTAMARDLRVQLRYFQWNPEFEKTKPYELLLDNIPDDFPVTNFETSPEEAEIIHDIRGMEKSFTLEDHGFCIVEQRLDFSAFDQVTVEDLYLPQVKDLLKGMMPKIHDLFIFDWRLRSSDRKLIGTQFEGEYLDLADQTNRLLPAEAVHIDQSPVSACKRVTYHMKDRAPELLERKFQVINVWRPIHHAVEDYPLAICDASTVRSDRVIAADHVRRDYQGESYYPLYTPGYKWYYLSYQTEHEVTVFKTYDSRPAGSAKVGCPHTAFKVPDVHPDAPPRESIEVRVLVFFNT